MSGGSLAVRIPKDCRFACDDILIERWRGRVILTPRFKSWREYFPYSTRFLRQLSRSHRGSTARQAEKLLMPHLAPGGCIGIHAVNHDTEMNLVKSYSPDS
jgi:virulence-associated protein VagC